MKLAVLHIPQEKQNSCWHASARMLYGYRKMACIHPMPKEFDHNQGITPEQFIELAKELGLKTLPPINQSYGWRFLQDALERYGPLWAAGQWNGPNHIVVITGVDAGGRVFVNDPAFPAPAVRDIAWFNEKIDKDVSVPLMYLP
jgi:hypothetical protein